MDTEKQVNRRNWIEIFKYNAILSTLFFLGSTVYLSGQAQDYSFSKYTISQLSYFLNPQQLSFFNLLFIVKALLDLSFTFYIFRKFKGQLNFITAFVWLAAILSFGLIGFFPVSQFFIIHWILAICLFFFWTLSELVFARLTKSRFFTYFTNNLVLIQLTTIVLLFALNQVNALFEIVYFLLALFWLIVFIGEYM